MKVLVVRVGQAPAVEEIDGSLHAMQELVDGYIECVTIDDGVVLVCNEEGLIRGLPRNCPLFYYDMVGDWLHGDFFICGTDEEEFTDLSDEMIKKWSFIYDM